MMHQPRDEKRSVVPYSSAISDEISAHSVQKAFYLIARTLSSLEHVVVFPDGLNNAPVSSLYEQTNTEAAIDGFWPVSVEQGDDTCLTIILSTLDRKARYNGDYYTLSQSMRLSSFQRCKRVA